MMKRTLSSILSRSFSSHFNPDLTAQEIMDLENRYVTQNYIPLDVVIERGDGVYVWDVDGNRYFDFLSAFSAVSQGHNHPRIIEALTNQSETLSVISRAFHNDMLGIFSKHVTSLLGYDRVCPMNTGAEGIDTSIKLARKWGYNIKGIPENEALIVCLNNNFHGRTLAAISMSPDQNSKDGFRPLLPGIMRIDNNDVGALESVLNDLGSRICAFIAEPIQAALGIRIPDMDYFTQVRDLCDEHEVLLVADEVQTGLGRVGEMVAMEDHFGVRPDILILGKALSGGCYPISAVLADDDVMGLFTPGTHGSTFGGNPIACAVGIAALEVIVEEDLCTNARRMGELFRSRLRENVLNREDGIVTDVRGIGLLNAIQLDNGHEKMKERDLDAKKVCSILKDNGILSKHTYYNIIRFAPPLIINEEQMMECLSIIEDTILEIEES